LAILLGFLFSFFWFTREESLWIVPLLFMGLLFLCNNKSSCFLRFKQSIGSISLALITMSAFAFSVYALTCINNHCYGSPVTLEVKSSPFKKAYGALLRVKHDDFKDIIAIPVPREVREKIYKVSPAFRELKPFFKGSRGQFWTDILYHFRHKLEQNYSPAEMRDILADFLQEDNTGVWRKIWDDAREKKGEIYAPWFIWAFREGVFDAGYSTLPKAMEYYDRLGSEIYTACEQGKLDCFPLRSSLMPPWDGGYLPLLEKALSSGIIRLVSFWGFKSVPDFSVGDQESLDLFRWVTHEELMPVYSKGISFQSKDYRFKIMQGLGVVYGKAVPVFFVLSALCYFFRVIRLKLLIVKDEICTINTGLLFSILLLLLALSYIHITSFPALLVRYMAPLYPLMLLFVFLSLSVYISALGSYIFPGKKNRMIDSQEE
jgi:hypothetical protein